MNEFAHSLELIPAFGNGLAVALGDDCIQVSSVERMLGSVEKQMLNSYGHTSIYRQGTNKGLESDRSGAVVVIILIHIRGCVFHLHFLVAGK